MYGLKRIGLNSHGPIYIGLLLSGKLLSFDEVCLFHRNYTKENIGSSIVNYKIFSHHLPGLVTKNRYGEIILLYRLLKILFL